MTADTRGLEDPSRWTVTILPLPRRQSRAKASGLCGGFAVGESEGTGLRCMPHWWPNGRPEPLVVAGQKRLAVRRARDSAIPGWWQRSNGSNGGAVGWRLGPEGALATIDLHDPGRYAWTAAMGAGGDCFVGYGEPKAKKGQRAVERALLWRADGTLVDLAVAAGEEAIAEATDGAWVVGSHGGVGAQRAALWNAQTGELVSLGPPRALSEAYGVGDDEQVGVAWTGRGGRAALWRGSAASFVDLTPADQECARAGDCAAGYQVGHCQAALDTRGEVASLALRAALWAGTADSHVDLQAFVPPPWNASSASAVEVRADRLRIVGEVTQFVVEGELTPRERHLMAAEAPVMWEAILG